MISECSSFLVPISPPQFTQGRIDIGIIKLIHQDPEGYMVLWRKHDRKGDWHNKSIKISNLENEIANLEDQLLEDCYMTVNSFNKPRRNHYRMEYRKKDMLYSLNACFSDLDCYNVGLEFEEARMALEDMAKQNQIPHPSMIASSGRGMYVHWLLEQSDINDREIIKLYDHVQVQIYETLKGLGADFKAKDASRVLRIPGSFHLKAPQRVCYSACENSQGVITRFNLVELANMFPPSDRRMPQSKKMLNSGISCKLSEAISKGALPPGCLFPKNLPAADSKVKKVALAHIRELCAIAEKRGGIKEGCRHNFLWIYANRLYVLGVPIEELADYLLEINAYGCDPPCENKDVFYASSGIKRYLSDHSGRIYQRNSCSIAEELQITTKEVELYDLKYIVPIEVRYRRKCENTERTMRRRMERTEKQGLLVKMIERSENEGVIMGRSALSKALRVAPQTITNWKRLMKIPVNPRGRPRTNLKNK